MGLNRQLANLPDAITTDTSNNVGIGGSPSGSYKLDVTGTGRFSNNNNNLSLDNPSGQYSTLNFRNANTIKAQLYWDNTANKMFLTDYLSIGSTGAATFSAATSAITLTANGAANQWTTKILASSTTSQSYGLTVQAGTNSSDIGLQVIPVSGSGSLLYVRGDGNVGIGTSSPTNFSGYTTLTVNGTSGGVLNLQYNGTDGLRILSQSTTSEIYEARNLPMVFSTNATERMRISDGSVGINNTNPVNTAWGSGTSTKQLSITGSNAAVINLQNTSGVAYFSMGVSGTQFYPAYNNTTSKHAYIIGSTNVMFITDSSGTQGTLVSTERLNVNGSIYATQYNAALNTSNSQVSTGSIEIQSFAVNNSWIGDNLYYSGGWKARNAGTAAQIYFGAYGTITFNTGGQSSYTAGQTVTNKSVILIEGTGNLNLGGGGGIVEVASTADADYTPSGYRFITVGKILAKGSSSSLSFTDRTYVADVYGWYSNASVTYFRWETGGGGAGVNVASINGSSGAYTALSDINYKKDLEDSTIGLDAILNIKPTLYRLKGEDEAIDKHLGFIAQQVKPFIPQAYVESDSGDGEKFIGLNDRAIIAALVKGMQEQNQTITSLQDRLDKLENK